MPLKPNFQKLLDKFIDKYGKKKGNSVFQAYVKEKDLNPELKSFVIFSEQFKSLDDDIVSGYFATGDKDAYNDILSDSCLNDMVEQIKALPFTIDDNHESFKDKGEGERFRAFNPIAKVISAKKVGNRIEVKTILNKAHKRYEEIKSSIKNGFLHSFSFAYIPIKKIDSMIEGVKARILDKVNLLNICFTGIPVNENARITGIALKSLNYFDGFDDLEIDKVVGGFKMSDEGNADAEKPVDAEIKSLIEGELKSFKEKIDLNEVELKAKSEELKASNEELKAKLEELKAFNEELKGFKDEVKAVKELVDSHEKVLCEPQFKAKMEQMESIIKDKNEEETKSVNAIDLI